MSGILDRLRKLSGRMSEEGDTPRSEGTASPTKINPWRGVFDPASNPNVKMVGSSYYDRPDPSNPKTTWDYHLDAEKAAAKDLTGAAFKATGAKADSDTLDAAALQKMFSPERVSQIMAEVDRNKDGKISYTEFCKLMRSHGEC